jgi:hypothetical protein
VGDRRAYPRRIRNAPRALPLMNNPEALVIVALGLFMMVLGFKGKTDNMIAAVKGKPYGQSSLK